MLDSAIGNPIGWLLSSPSPVYAANSPLNATPLGVDSMLMNGDCVVSPVGLISNSFDCIGLFMSFVGIEIRPPGALIFNGVVFAPGGAEFPYGFLNQSAKLLGVPSGS